MTGIDGQLKFGLSRFRQIAGDKGVKWALGYFLRYLGSFAENTVAETGSRLAEIFPDVTPAKKPGTETITYGEFRKMKEKDHYYEGRWDYMRKVMDIAKKESPKKVLELGPRRMPVVKGADTMDMQYHGHELTYAHDARTIPWPVEDRKYDMFIALQVWEHLEGKQAEAFIEVMRISKSAIMSFPYKRYFPGDCHHDVDEKVISGWTLNKRPEKIIKAGPVIVYFFRF